MTDGRTDGNGQVQRGLHDELCKNRFASVFSVSVYPSVRTLMVVLGIL